MSIISESFLTGLLANRAAPRPQPFVHTARRLLKLTRFRTFAAEDVGKIKEEISKDMANVADRAYRAGQTMGDIERAVAKAYILHCAKMDRKSPYYDKVVVDALYALGVIVDELRWAKQPVDDGLYGREVAGEMSEAKEGSP